MKLLPHWVLTNKNPAFYDSESATAIEQTAKVYAAMQELIKEYNKFVDGVNQQITDFINDTNKDYEVFRIGLRQEFQDFIDVVELKLMSQDKEIQDAINYMQTNLTKTVTTLIKEMRENGELTQEILVAFEEMKEFITNYNLDYIYDKNSESLILIVTNNTSITKEICEVYTKETETLTLSIE